MTILQHFLASSRRLLTLFALGLALGLASPALAQQGEHNAPPGTIENMAEKAVAEHGGHEPNAGVLPTLEQGIVPSLVALGVFAVVFMILAKAVWPKILGGLKDRENKIREEIESAEMARKQAKDALEQYQKSLADARSEAQKMIETTRAQQANIAADLRAKAEIELNQLRERAMKDIEAAKRAAVSEIYGHSTTLATAMASKILRRTVNPGDTQQLVEESMAQLQAAAKG